MRRARSPDRAKEEESPLSWTFLVGLPGCAAGTSASRRRNWGTRPDRQITKVLVEPLVVLLRTGPNVGVRAMGARWTRDGTPHRPRRSSYWCRVRIEGRGFGFASGVAGSSYRGAWQSCPGVQEFDDPFIRTEMSKDTKPKNKRPRLHKSVSSVTDHPRTGNDRAPCLLSAVGFGCAPANCRDVGPTGGAWRCRRGSRFAPSLTPKPNLTGTLRRFVR